MKVLFYTKYTRLGASSRLRTYQFFPHFETSGVTCSVSPLFNEQYLEELYKKKKISKWNVLKGYLNRFFSLFTVAKYDVIVIEKELFPFFPAFAEMILYWANVKYVVDYDDAIFHNYDTHPNNIIRTFLGRKIANIMKHSALVVAGNSYLRNYAEESGAENVIIVPTVIDTNQYIIQASKASSEIVIGWIGSPTSFHNLDVIAPVLREICDTYQAKLHLVGSYGSIGLKEHEVIIPWTEESEVELISSFDIGIMPLKDDLWQRGKCGYKLIQYMGCALPVVGSPVGANNDIIKEGINGYKPETVNEWREALENLVTNKNQRILMGIEGRKMIEANYSLNSAAAIWLTNLTSLVKG